MPCTFFLFTTFTWRKFLVKHEIWNGTNTHTYTYRHIRIKRRMLSANTGCSTFDNVITSLQPTAATTMVIRARHFLFLIFYVLFSSLFHMFVPLKNRTPPKDKSNAWIMNERLLQKKNQQKDMYADEWVFSWLLLLFRSTLYEQNMHTAFYSFIWVLSLSQNWRMARHLEYAFKTMKYVGIYRCVGILGVAFWF